MAEGTLHTVFTHAELDKEKTKHTTTSAKRAPPQKKQNEKEASYSLWRDEEDYFINWSLGAKTIERTINATGFPYSGARTNMENQIVKKD